LSCPLPQEVSKDTPRFPAYPRYKSSWELLIRLLGLTMDRTHMALKPLHSLDFAVQNVTLAGCKLTVQVQKDWNTILVDGEKVAEAVFDRRGSHSVAFVRE
jgi:hypothetical protein